MPVRAQAVARIYTAKGRPSFNPLIVHVADLAAAEALAELPPAALALAEAFWPGPVTIVAPLRPGNPIATLATAGLPTIALRVPAHPAMRALLAATRLPLAAPSANVSGAISPTRAEHVLRSLGGRVALVIDGGPCVLGLESTIVAITGDGLRLLRPGPIDPARLAAMAGLELVSGAETTVTAPGQLARHYAPSKPLRLNATGAHEGEWLIGFGAVAGTANSVALGNVGTAADLPALERTAGQEEELIAEHARWAIGRIGERLALAER